jgi:hypothetical protein
VLADKKAAIADDEHIYWPVVIRNGYFFSQGKHLLFEGKGNYMELVRSFYGSSGFRMRLFLTE